MVQENDSPLMYVAEHAKSLELVDVLLKAKAEVNARNIVSAWEGWWCEKIGTLWWFVRG